MTKKLMANAMQESTCIAVMAFWTESAKMAFNMVAVIVVTRLNAAKVNATGGS